MRKLTALGAAIVALAAATTFTPLTPAATSQPAAPIQLAFDEAQATAANGTIFDADELRVCGADDGSRFLAELLGGDPLNFKIPYRLADVVSGNTKPTSTTGRQMMVSGIVDSDVFGTGDFPFDHPGGSDFNMDVTLDPPYADISQSGGAPTGIDMHTELSEFGVPHLPTAPSGPPTGMTWEENSTMARTDIQPGYFPGLGDRVIVMGRWVNDCGHPPFQTELHPISFLAWSHTESNKTVAQTYYSPYREMQLYNIDRNLANQVNNPNRTSPFAPVLTKSFPAGLIASILRLQNLGGLPPIDHLESWGLLEANRTSPADWWVCAPDGTSGTTLNVNYDFVARPGVEISTTPDPASGCARMHTVLGTNVTPDPPLRTCVLPWDWLSQVAADEAGVPSLDLKEQIKSFIADQYDYRVDPDPIMDCYDPLKGPVVSPSPTGQNVTVDPAIAHPFYGRVEVFWSGSSPTTTTSSSTSTSSTPTGQNLTVAPSSVAQGGSVDVSSTGWLPDVEVTVTLDDGSTLGTITTDRFGAASGSFTIPSTTSTGSHSLTVSGATVSGDVSVSTSITVTAASAASSSTAPSATSGSLPRTGATIAGTVALGSLLVLVGIGVTGLARRRRPVRTS